MTTKDKILNILRLEGKIDNYRAIGQRITTRLSDVIFRLQREGKIELDEEKSGFLPNSRNWCYVVKPFNVKITEYKVNGLVVSTKKEYANRKL